MFQKSEELNKNLTHEYQTEKNTISHKNQEY